MEEEKNVLIESGLVDKGPFKRKWTKEYIKRMSQPNENVLFDNHVGSILLQQGYHWEESPRSIYDPSQLYSSLAMYGPKNHSELKLTPYLQQGIDLAFKVFSKPKDYRFLDVLRTDREVYHAIQLDTYAGLPYGTTKGVSFQYGCDREKQILQGLKSPNPCTALKRTQKNDKTRLVWGYPLEMNIMEARFARPIIEQLLDRRTTMAFGLKKYEVGHRVSVNVKGKGIPVGLDYSKFDATIPKNLIHMAFKIIKTWFSEEDLILFGFDIIEKYFIFTPIIMPDGHLYTGKDHGVPSGSYFTQVIDSIVNTILLGAMLSEIGENVSSDSIFVLGDDSLFPLSKPQQISRMRDILSQYGIRVNEEKSKFNELYFLGSYWEQGLPHLPLQEIINKSVFPESFRKYDKSIPYSQQAISILMSYASTYYEAWNLIPPPGRPMDVIDVETIVSGAKTTWVTGLQKYTFKYITGSFPEGTPVHVRYLL